MAQLRGSISFSGQSIQWLGKWGFGKEAFAAKDTGKFEFKAPGTAISDGSVVVFSGFFALKKDGTEKKVKVKEEGVTVTFSADEGGKLSGSGSGTNKFGSFTLAGKYDPCSGRFMVSKVYKTAEGGGQDDDGGFGGGSDGSGSDDENDGIDDDDAADELADLREDQVTHGLVLGSGGETKRGRSRGASSSSSSKHDGGKRGAEAGGGTKRLVKRKAGTVEGRDGEAGVLGNGGGGGDPKKAKRACSSSDPLPVPAQPFEAEALARSQVRLATMIAAGDPGGLLFILDELSAGGFITVAQLQSTGVGKEVRSLKKHSNAAVAEKAEEVQENHTELTLTCPAAIFASWQNNVVLMWKECVRLEGTGELAARTAAAAAAAAAQEAATQEAAEKGNDAAPAATAPSSSPSLTTATTSTESDETASTTLLVVAGGGDNAEDEDEDEDDESFNGDEEDDDEEDDDEDDEVGGDNEDEKEDQESDDGGVDNGGSEGSADKDDEVADAAADDDAAAGVDKSDGKVEVIGEEEEACEEVEVAATGSNGGGDKDGGGAVGARQEGEVSCSVQVASAAATASGGEVLEENKETPSVLVAGIMAPSSSSLLGAVAVLATAESTGLS